MDAQTQATTLLGRFSRILKNLREERNLSMNELAQRSQLSQSYVVQLEGGSRNPSLDTAIRLATGLGLSLSDFAEFLERD